MIAFLSGKVLYKGTGYVVVRVNDVGYKVIVSASQYAELDAGQPTEIYIYHHVREDASVLYGFRSAEQLEMFELMLSVSGIGPKSALAVLSMADVDDLRASIAGGDSSLLVKVSGIGKKTAERVVLELRDKMSRLSLPGTADGKSGNVVAGGDEIDALMALGYSLGQAREALSRVGTGVKDSGERVREALKKLGR